MPRKSLKNRILDNTFVTDIRYLQINHEQFAELCIALEELAIKWKKAKTIDKELASDLYMITRTAQYAGDTMREHGDKEYQVAYDMWLRLDALVIDCLSTSWPEA